MATVLKEQVIILHEGCTLESVGQVMEGLGWSRVPVCVSADMQSKDTCVRGIWANESGGHAQLVSDGYVQYLCVADASVAEWAAVARLPALSANHILELLAASEWETVVRGVRAAALSCDTTLFVALAQLRHHPEEAVRYEAVDAMQRLLPEMVKVGALRLHERMKRNRGAHPLWSEFEPAWLRRQILRWLLRDYVQATPGVESVLRAALTDSDWEVRVGAVVGVTRLGIKALGGLVEKCPLPTVSRNGPDTQDRALIRELRRVACALLAGRLPPPLSATASPRLRVMDRLAKCLTDRAPEVADHISLLVHALTTPVLPTEPCGERGGLEVVVVPAARGYAGDGLSIPVSPIESHEFLLAVDPVSDADGPLALDAGAARAWLASMAGAWRVPSVDEWTFAVRGNDGRRFPWGNGLQEDAHLCPGPWGTWGHGTQPEWALDASGKLCRCGPLPGDIAGDDGGALLRPVWAGG
jgi:hypothetical protein